MSKQFKFDYVIDEKQCWDCATCVVECRDDAVFVNEEQRYQIDGEKCIRCARCFKGCPVNAIEKVSNQASA